MNDIIDNMVTVSRVKNKEMEDFIDLRSEDFIGISAEKLWESLGL